MKYLILSFIYLLFISCSHDNRIANMDKTKKHIIFVPGFYGTQLKEKESGTRVWLTAANSLFGKTSIAQYGYGVAGEKDLVPSRILDHVTVIPWLYYRDVYGDIVEFLKDDISDDIVVHTLAYDWRKDYYHGVLALDKLINELKAKGIKDINLVAHSLGGLVSSYYLRYGVQDPKVAQETWEGAKKVNTVFMATVPFHGCLLSFRNKFKGVNFIPNEDLINANVLSSFVTNYQMLPVGQKSFYNNNLDLIDHDLLTFEQWTKNNWGFLHKDTDKEYLSKRIALVKESLNKTKLMYSRLTTKSENKVELKNKFIYFKGIGRPTMTRGILHNTGSKIIPLFDKEDLKKFYPVETYEKLFSKGDETLSEETAELIPVIKNTFANLKTYEVNAIHSKVYNHEDVRKKLKDVFSN